LLRWVAKAGGTTEFSNQYLFPGNKRSEPNAVVSTYRMPQTSDWDLVGQELDRELAPGESYETYIASSDDGTAEIQGPHCLARANAKRLLAARSWRYNHD